MTVQLVFFVLVFFVPVMVLFFIRYRSIPAINKEENTYSREFWMFIGSLLLFLSSILIIARTSVPVYNKIFGTNIAMPEDNEFAYNQIQVFVAIIIGILTATTQYFKYKNTSDSYFGKKIWLPTLIAVIISACISLFGNINFDKKGIGFLVAIHVAVFAAVYSITANASYIWIVLKGRLKVAGASVAHVGFGLVLLGILISSSKKDVLSKNTTGINVFQKSKGEDPAENITLFKGLSTDMGRYMVTYTKDTFNDRERKRFFEIDFKSKNGKEHFQLYPDLIKNNKGMEGFAANPSSKHYWYKDIFVYISAYEENKKEDTATYHNKELKVGDTLYYSNGLMILNRVAVNPPEQKSRYNPDENALFLDMTIVSKDGKRYAAMPGIALKTNTLRSLPDTVKAQSLALKFNKVTDQNAGKLEIGFKESGAITDLITLKVYEFPMINVLWIGVVIMVLGFVLSIIQRLKTAMVKNS
jgi:cytochrome c-type biogenesis protein CcmF